MTYVIGIMFIVGGIILGIQAKRDFYKEISRWTLFEVASSACGIICGISILVGVLDITPVFTFLRA